MIQGMSFGRIKNDLIPLQGLLQGETSSPQWGLRFRGWPTIKADSCGCKVSK